MRRQAAVAAQASRSEADWLSRVLYATQFEMKHPARYGRDDLPDSDVANQILLQRNSLVPIALAATVVASATFAVAVVVIVVARTGALLAALRAIIVVIAALPWLCARRLRRRKIKKAG